LTSPYPIGSRFPSPGLAGTFTPGISATPDTQICGRDFDRDR
jgi:hypothetical protein